MIHLLKYKNTTTQFIIELFEQFFNKLIDEPINIQIREFKNTVFKQQTITLFSKELYYNKFINTEDIETKLYKIISKIYTNINSKNQDAYIEKLIKHDKLSSLLIKYFNNLNNRYILETYYKSINYISILNNFVNDILLKQYKKQVNNIIPIIKLYEKSLNNIDINEL